MFNSYIELCSEAGTVDEDFVIGQTREYNRRFTENDYVPLNVFAKAEDGSVVGGLTGKTYWNYFEINFLWVSENNRRSGHGSTILATAEAEAFRRGCKAAFLDTFAFQAPEFYRKVGYSEFGKLSGFAGKATDEFERYYFTKKLVEISTALSVAAISTRSA